MENQLQKMQMAIETIQCHWLQNEDLEKSQQIESFLDLSYMQSQVTVLVSSVNTSGMDTSFATFDELNTSHAGYAVKLFTDSYRESLKLLGVEKPDTLEYIYETFKLFVENLFNVRQKLQMRGSDDDGN